LRYEHVRGMVLATPNHLLEARLPGSSMGSCRGSWHVPEGEVENRRFEIFSIWSREMPPKKIAKLLRQKIIGTIRSSRKRSGLQVWIKKGEKNNDKCGQVSIHHRGP